MGSLLNLIEDWKYNLQKKVHDLRYIFLEVTRHCNLNCLHCYSNSGRSQKGAELPTEAIISLANSVKQTFGPEIAWCLTGGEPLIRPDILDILKHLAAAGFPVGMATNGLAINSGNIAALANLLGSLSISFDGLRDSHNFLRNAAIYERTLNAIRTVADFGRPALVIKTVVYKRNLSELEKLLEMVQSFGASLWHLIPIEPWGRADQRKNLCLDLSEYTMLYNFAQSARRKTKMRIVAGEAEHGGLEVQSGSIEGKRHCHAGISSFSVLANGDVVSCVSHSKSGKMAEGNIMRENIGEIWERGFQKNRSRSYCSCGDHYQRGSHEEAETVAL